LLKLYGRETSPPILKACPEEHTWTQEGLSNCIAEAWSKKNKEEKYNRSNKYKALTRHHRKNLGGDMKERKK
jgi:hypothetical protein